MFDCFHDACDIGVENLRIFFASLLELNLPFELGAYHKPPRDSDNVRFNKLPAGGLVSVVIKYLNSLLL